MEKVRKKLHIFCEQIDRQIIFMAVVITLAICYYINPLTGVDLTDWNRTFSPAMKDGGISISQRISNFYVLFLIWIPSVFLIVLFFHCWVSKYRNVYKESFLKINILIMFSIAASYLSRYSEGGTEINSNVLIQTALSFYFVFLVIGLLDKTGQFSFSDITAFCVTYMIAVIDSNVFLGKGSTVSIGIISVLMLSGISVILYVPGAMRIFRDYQNIMFLFMWTPAVMRLALEGIYYFTEQGSRISRYYTHTARAVLAYILLAVIITFLLKKKKTDLAIMGYIGAIVSMGLNCFLSHDYQYVWQYGSTANLYETGNFTVAVDTILHGKIPVIDYFSAHALSDVWTRILYSLIHSDIKGIFANPYGGLAVVLAYICLFYIVLSLFDRDIAVLFACLFPINILGIKFTSVCCISVVMLLYLINNPKKKSNFIFWIAVLVSAFVIYDEGISLGISCIIAYLVIQFTQKEWKRIKFFIASGILTGIGAIGFYVIYGCITGLDIVSRIGEWISVSLGSNSSWATKAFGETSSPAFLFSYFIVPVCAIYIFTAVLVKYLHYKKEPLLAAITMAFALAEILYIPRTIVFHNLAGDGGQSGVLLNYIHWSAALYVLYSMALKEHAGCRKLLGWISALGISILCEGGVTEWFPGTGSVLYAATAGESVDWKLEDDVTENWGKDRIVFDETAMELSQQFKDVFDTLLTEEQTFIDFANVTSMYALTGRERPFYVGQSPSLLTDLYSQDCFLAEIAEYDCPLAVVGTTGSAFLQQMWDVPHNIRYYKIAEYIYANYRPLLRFGEFAIWCEREYYNDFHNKLSGLGLVDGGYELVDYGYDATAVFTDEEGNTQYTYQPYHDCALGRIPYVWANYDDYNAIENDELLALTPVDGNLYRFEGSQSVNSKGNYLAFECTNGSEGAADGVVTFQDSSVEGARFQYGFYIYPGTEQYLIRVSGDYFWDIYNIDSISIESDDADLKITHVRVLEGD